MTEIKNLLTILPLGQIIKGINAFSTFGGIPTKTQTLQVSTVQRGLVVKVETGFFLCLYNRSKIHYMHFT